MSKIERRLPFTSSRNELRSEEEVSLTQQMPKQRRHLSFLLLFISASLFAIPLLLLAFNGLSFLFFAQNSGNPLPSILALREETQHPSSWKRNQFLTLLRPTSRSNQFSARAAQFFNGYSPNSSCNPRFFMTWISKIEFLGQKELLSMESLFKFHPNACLLIVSNAMDSPQGTQFLKPFSDLGFRVAAISPDFAFLFKNTPAEIWFERLRQGALDPGGVSLGQNLSNLLRLALLYKLGGIYIDVDVLVLKSLLGLNNVIGAQSMNPKTRIWTTLNNAVLIFDQHNPLLYKFIAEFARTFDGNRWGHNGPYLVSRVVSRMAGKPGFEFTVLPPVAFYPVDWKKIQGWFRGPRGGADSKWVAAVLDRVRRESFAVHLWNKMSRDLEVEEGSVIGRIMADCCLFCNSSVSAL